MSLIDLASLVLAPTAVKDGKVYNAIPNDQDFTFSRGTEATRVNSAGLIEKARTNFLLQSNTFDTTWLTIRSSVTSGIADPFGGSNAWSFLTDNTANDQHYIYQGISQSGVGTLSIYAKANGYNWLRLRLPSEEAYFDVSNGVTGSSTTGISASITDVSNGWYRCEVAISDMSTNPNVFMHIAENDGDIIIDGTPSGNDGLYIYSAQLEQGLVATDVITTTTSSVTVGITDDLPRVDYSGGGCPSLLLEPSRTQLVTQAEYFGAWNNARTIDTDNQATSPEGVINAAYLEQQSGQTNAGSIYFGVTFPSTSDYTTSIFAKKGEKDFIVAYDKNTDRTYFNLDTGTVGTTPAGVTASIEDFGNGWYRCSATFNTAAGGGNIAWYLGDTDNSSTVTDSGGVYIYGAMLEAGSYVSSYLPSYGTSTSRSADSCSLTNASNLIGQSEGTFYWEGSFQNSINPILLQLIPSSGNYTNSIYLEYTGGNIRISSWYSGTLQAQISVSASLNTNYKVAFAYKENDFVAYVNGTSIGSDTSGSIPDGLSRVFIGQLNSTTAESFVGCKPKQAILFPTRLTNDQLAELTK